MSEKILVFTAWPYANGDLHLGHIAGCFLPADIFARFNRTLGNDVLMLSGSDQHGTPITVRAEKEGVTPGEIADRFHNSFVDCWKAFGISYDLYTKTTTDNHRNTVHAIFLDLLEKGYIYKKVMQSPYCGKCARFLPDRYVEGVCPFCNFEGARGDQCDECGKTLDPQDLVKAQCKFCGTEPEIRDTEHFFFKLSAFNEDLIEWLTPKTYFRPNVYAFTKRYLIEGLKDRAITRDISWGITVPVAGYEDKRIYVWFEAVIGYLSAAKEWAKNKNEPELWEYYWKDSQCRAYYFIGKDNIPFHTIIWPAILMGYNNGLQLPFDVPSNEFLNLEGRQLSTSRNWAVWLPDYLERYDPDPLRYVLSINMPETSDTDFSWHEFFRRNNNELVATYGNLVHRTLSFTHKRFEGKVPIPGELIEEDEKILDLAKSTLEEMREQISRCSFREALRTAMNLAHKANQYLEVTSPWAKIKEDPERAGTSLWVTFQLINTLKTALYPYLPFSSVKIHKILGYQSDIEKHGWKFEQVPGGTEFAKPEPLFKKLEESMVEEEVSKLGIATV
jgi:methionyl-tRNA synthetase